ncbi:3D domain-containing protein [Paradesulfitobacterium aromaticivorans]
MLLVPALILICLNIAVAPELSAKVDAKRESVQISRGETEPKIEKRIMTITAYTKNDPGMDGRGITKNGELVKEGRTIAADESIPFGTEIYIPALGKTYTVTDRGGDIKGNRLDLFMESREAAFEFGAQELDVLIIYTSGGGEYINEHRTSD